MSNQPLVEDVPLVVDRAETADEDARRRDGRSIIAGVAGAILVVVLAWLALTMLGVLPG